MRMHFMATVAAGTLAVGACGSPPQVRTTVAPDAGLGGLTFHVMPAPDYLGGVTIGANRPLLLNTATTQALRDHIAANLVQRGYVPAVGEAGVLVVYRIARPALTDVTDWEYGYHWRPAWARHATPVSVDLTPTEYADGAVIVDMIDARTGALLWRGQGVTRRPDDERRYTRDLRQTVTAILARLPEPSIALNSTVAAEPAQ